ncbi:MAG: hypothetical protein AAFV29_05605, partial [Myxococcota bacterium]
LGMTAYRALVGELPPEGEREAPQTVERLSTKIPRPMALLIAELTCRYAKGRPSSAKSVRLKLEQLRANALSAEAAPRTTRRASWLWRAVLLLTAGAMVGLIVFARSYWALDVRSPPLTSMVPAVPVVDVKETPTTSTDKSPIKPSSKATVPSEREQVERAVATAKLVDCQYSQDVRTEARALIESLSATLNGCVRSQNIRRGFDAMMSVDIFPRKRSVKPRLGTQNKLRRSLVKRLEGCLQSRAGQQSAEILSFWSVGCQVRVRVVD